MVNRVLISSVVGTAIEWYDFFLYGTGSALVFGKLFFPTVRPVGRHDRCLWDLRGRLRGAPVRRGLLRPFRRPHRTQGDAGRHADDHGRRNVRHRPLPTYETIGIWAPSCSCRCASCRGLAWAASGAARCCSSWRRSREQARLLRELPAARRADRPAAVDRHLRAVRTLPDEQFLAWGWRIPFLLSVVLVGGRSFHPAARRRIAGVRGGQGDAHRCQGSADRALPRHPKEIFWRSARALPPTSPST